MDNENLRSLHKTLQGAGYNPPEYDEFARDMENEENLRGVYTTLKNEGYTPPDYEQFKTDMGFGMTHEPKYGSKSTFDDSPYGTVKEPKQVEWQTREGETVRVDTVRPSSTGNGAAIVEVEKPRAQVASDTSEDAQERAMLMSKESLDDFYSYEPNTEGKMTFGWRRGARIGQLNENGMWLMNATGGYENESYRSAEKEAEQMSDEQLIAAFNKLSSRIGDREALAGMPEGYDDASVLRAYARELRARDVGYGHASEMHKGGYHYMAARSGDSGVANEIDALESLPPEQRLLRLRDAYRKLTTMQTLEKQGLMQDEDEESLRAARRVLAAGTAIYAKEKGIYPEEAYNAVMNMAGNVEKQTGFMAGFEQGLESMGEGIRHLVGEAASLFEGDRMDYAEAGRKIAEEGDNAETSSMIAFGGSVAQWLLSIANPINQTEKVFEMMHNGTLAMAIKDAFDNSRDAEGHIDINKANRYVEQRMKQDLGWGERQMRQASINMSNMPQVEGVGAWIGQNVAQMMPSATAILVGVTTKSPTLAQAIGNIGMGAMVAASAGSAMQEARQYGASDDEVWMTGISNGMLEWVTEKIPFDRYTKRVFGSVKARTTQRLLNALQTSEGRSEFNTLLKQAKKELARGTGIKAYMGDVLAEGVSEFAAGTTQKMCEMIYKRPEDYPTLYECLQDGWDGFLAGAFMGGTMGGVSIGTTRLQSDARRKQAGNVTIGFINLEDGGAQMVEVLGADAQGNVTILRGDGAEPETVRADEIPLMHTYTYDEWHKGEMQRFADEAEEKGANLEGVERTELSRRSGSLRDAVVQWLGEEGLANAERDPVGMLEQVMNDDWSEAQKQQMQEYVESLLMYDGVIARVNDDIDTAISEANERIDNQTNVDTGKIHHGKLVDESDVYVIGGIVVTDNDGNIDLTSSTPDIVVLDSDGNKKFMSISQLGEVDEPVNPDELRAESTNNIRQQMGQAAADEIDGILPFAIGDTYHIIFPLDGTEHDVQVLQDNGDGTVTVAYDGDAQNTQVVIKGDLQAWADEAAHQYIEPASADNAASGTGEQTTDGVVAGTTDAGNASEGEELSEIELAHRELYSDPDMSVEDNDQLVLNNIAAAKEALKKAQKANEKPINETDRAKYKAERMKRNEAIAQAQAELDYWQGIKDVQDSIVRAERERAAAEQAERDRIAHEQAVAEAQAEEAARRAAEEERRQRGANAAHPAIREKWDAAPKIDGNSDEIVLPNGERMQGHYVLVESGAATPSHNPNEEFAKNEGFPVDENGQTINDRDYERDKDAQDITREMGRTYDSRALQDVPVVSRDGVVLSGNGRTMAGELAARGNTDGAYIDYLKNYGGKFGFIAEQVGSMAHPRVVFVPDADMPYTTDTFAKFNAQEKKGMSVTELAVKLGKTVPDDVFRRILQVLNEYDTLGAFYADTRAATGVINELRNAGVIGVNEYGQMFDGDTISERGKEMIESMLIGKAFEGSPDAIRQLTEFKSLRQSVVSALSEIVNNIALGDEYSLADELSAAIDLCYKARKAGIQAGKPVSGFARQGVLFPADGEATVADYTNAAMLLLADMLNDNRPTLLRRVLSKYNGEAADAAAGGMDLFSGTRKEKSDIIKNVLNYLDYGQEANERTSEEAEPEAESVQQVGDAGTGVGGGEQSTGGNAAIGQGDLAQAEVTAPLSDEVNEFGKPFVLSSDGTTTFGEVDPESGLKAAPIKLSLGENIVDEEGKNHGYGLLHIKAGHEKEILKMFSSIEEFVEKVARNYDTIREGGVIADNQTYLLEISDEHNNTLFIQLSRDGSYWNVNSAGIFNTKYSRRRAKVHTRPALRPGTGTDSSGVDSGHSDGATAPAGNSPRTSDGKGSEISGTGKENGEKVADEQKVSDAASETSGHRTEDSFKVGDRVYVENIEHVVDGVNPDGTLQLRSLTPMHVHQMNIGADKVRRPGSQASIDYFYDVFSKKIHEERYNESSTRQLLDVVDKDIDQMAPIIKSGDVSSSQAEQFARLLGMRKALTEWLDSGAGSQVAGNTEQGAAPAASEHEGERAMALFNGLAVGDVFTNDSGMTVVIDKIVNSKKNAALRVKWTQERENGQSGRGIEIFNALHFLHWVEAKRLQKQPKTPDGSASETSETSRLVSDARMEELKKKLRNKLRGQANMGIDPEVIVIGAELAIGHIERGVTKFADYARAMISDIGDAIRPYLKAFYNAVRDMPEASDYVEQMDSYDVVSRFDVANFDKGSVDALATAETIAQEREVRKLTTSDGRALRPATTEDLENAAEVWYNGEHHRILILQREGEMAGNVTATAPRITKVVLDDGRSVPASDLWVLADVLTPSQPQREQVVGSLFGDMLDDEESGDDAGEVAGNTGQEVEKPKPASELSGDSSDEQERMRQERNFVNSLVGNIISLANKSLRGEEVKSLTMTDVKRMLEPYSLLQDYSTTDLQELVELAMTMATRNVAQRAMYGDASAQRAGYAKVVAQYMMQPTLSARDSTRMERQQYSTPTPFGYVMGQFLQAGRKVDSMLEPSAGNGALTITFNPAVVHVNDIDERRVANLRTLGYGQVTTQNALLPFEGEQVDAVGTNPPFGSVAIRKYDDGLFSLTSLEGQMSINALDAMKDDGRAAIIIGGNTEYRENGVMGAKDMKFFSYLYSHYNVVDVINMDGAMYARNGTKYPVRIILIDGRRHPQGTVLTREQRVVPPVKSKARAEQVKTFDELYNRVQDDILQIQQPRTSGQPSDTSGVSATTSTTDGGAKPAGSSRPHAVAGGQSVSPSRGNGRAGDSQPSERPSRPGEPSGTIRTGEQGAASDVAVDDRGGSRGSTSVAGQQPRGENRPVERGSVSGEPVDRGTSSRERLSVAIGEEKVAYPQGSAAGNFQSRVPANQAEAIAKTLGEIGDVDQFVVDQLGYSSKEELFSHMAAEQIDGIALAITQMNKGKAFIIGDMTGVGKGRQAAGLIRYALHQGKVPIFFTQKAGLFSDMHRDLSDIGSGGLRPFIIGSSTDATITDADGNVVHRLPSKAEQERVFNYIMEHGTLPDEYDYVVTTYSQIQNGTMDYEAKSGGIFPTARKGKKGASALGNAAAKNGQRKREVLARLSHGNICVLDESHTVGGDGGGAMFMQYLMQKVGGVTFLSATFAKRADNMPIYAMKTDISECGVAPAELIEAIQQGGVTLQEIMSKQLVQSGQMIRRERDFRGVTIDWMPVSDEQGEKQRGQFDEVASIFDGIRSFQDQFVKPAIEEISEELSEQGSFAGVTQGTEALGVKNVPFASKMYNLVNQLLFALKVEAVADRVIWNLEHGFKPVISFTNTMEGFLSELPKNEPMDEMPDFSLTLLRALDGVLRYTTTDMDQNSEGGMVPLSKLSPEGRAAYDSLRDRILHLSAGLTISPMDAIRMKIEQAGYKVAEITGRQTELAQTDDGRYVVRNRSERDKKAAARGFNDGSIDVLMINKSGSTGISLHSSTKFKDQRQRVMVFAQFQSDINDEVQMRGRIDRTGQVSRGKYEYIMSTIPAEQRLQMMFKSKLKSLDANTTSSQKSKFNEMEVVDFLNKYGDEVVWDYMLEHPELAERLGDPLKQLASKDDEDGSGRSRRGENDSKAGCAAKIARYLPFLPVAQQDEIFRDIVEAYQVKIQLLNDAGENDLEITTMPLRAETRSRAIWKEGVNPGSGNAFADNTYLEEVDVDILRKPMKSEEVRAYSERLREGKSWEEWKQEKLTAIKERILDKLNSTLARLREQTEARADKRRQKYIEQAKKYRELGKNQMTDAEIAELAETEYRGVMDELDKKVEAHRRRASGQYQAIASIIDRFTPLQPLIIPTNLSDAEISLTPSYGTFVGIKFNRDYSMSASTAVFATLDGRRKVELPLTSERELNIIEGQTRMQSYALRELSMDNWDSKVPTSTRKRAYIVTGNLLQALVDVQGTEGVKGTLVTYTTMSGDVRQGILMSDSFEPKALKNKVSIEKSADAIRQGAYVTSSDGEVELMNFGHMGYRLQVPKSKARGEKYFGNDKLRKLVRRGEFETRGGKMVAFFDEENLVKILRVLGRELGVTVTVDSQLKQVKGDEGVMFRDGDVVPQRASGNDDTTSENFKRWFGDWENDPENASKVVDENGEPLVVYRGGEKINIFEKDRASKMAMYGQAFYATPSRYDAEGFAKERTGDSGNVQAVYIDIRNPWVDSTCESMGYPKEASREQAKELIDLLKKKGLVDGEIILTKWEQGRLRSLLGALAEAEYEGRTRGRFERWHASDIVQDALKELGYDGVIGRFNSGEGMVDQVAAFESTQIKSATENNGDYSRENPDVRYREGEMSDAGLLFREEDNPDVLARLNSGETVTVYRAMQLIDGKLYPPMSAIKDGQLRGGSERDVWEVSEESLDTDSENFRYNESKGCWEFLLQKNDEDDGMWVAYNPYFHTCYTMLNDQFSSAQDRDNIVVVECEIPASELTSDYKAEGAKDGVGEVAWHSGVVSPRLPESMSRQVVLSRWVRIKGIVPYSKVAQESAAMLRATKLPNLPSNVFPKELRRELEKLGFEFVETNNQGKIVGGEHAGESWTKVYGGKTTKQGRFGKAKGKRGSGRGTAASRGTEGGVMRERSGRDAVRERKIYKVSDGVSTRRVKDYVTGEWHNIEEDNSDYRVEGMPGTYRGYDAALNAWRNYAPAGWTLSADGMTILQAPSAVEKPMTAKERKAAATWRDSVRKNGRAKIAELGQKLGIEFVIVDDMSNAEYYKLSKRKQRAKGWYDRSSRKMYIQLDAHGTSADIVRTILHEAVAHKGLRELFGKDFDTFLDNVYTNADAGIRREISRMAVQEYGGDFRVATEEYLARLAETTDFDSPQNRHFWSTVKRLFIEMLRKVGIVIPGGLSDSDLQYILWRSYNRMEERGALGAAEDVVMREKLEASVPAANTAAETATAAESQLSILWPNEGFAKRMHEMSDNELLENITESDGWDFYSQEYDDRHQRDYNEATDRFKAQFESMDEDGVREAFAEARERWDAGGFKSAERSELRAQMDMASLRLDEIEEDREWDDDYPDGPEGGGGIQAEGLHYDDVMLDGGVVSEPGAAGDGEILNENIPNERALRQQVSTFLSRNGIPSDFANIYIINGTDKSYEDVTKSLGLTIKQEQELRDDYRLGYHGWQIGGNNFIVYLYETLTQEELEGTLWHESVHIAFEKIPFEEQKRINNAIIRWLQKSPEGFDLYRKIIAEYKSKDWATEFAAHYFEMVYRILGVNALISDESPIKNKILRNFAKNIIEIIYGNEKDTVWQGKTRFGEQETGTETHGENEGGIESAERGANSGQRGYTQVRSGGAGEGLGDRGGRGVGSSDATDALFRDGDFTVRDREVARDEYEHMVSSGAYQFQEAVQDSMLGLKRLMQSVLGKETHMEDVVGYENAYLAENRMSSENAAEQHEYFVRYMKPLLEVIGKLCGRDANAREVLTDYMMAKHGLERNLVLAERDARETEKAGGNYQDAYNKNREKDYAGLTALTGEDDVVAAEAAAQQMVDDYERDHDVAELWSAVNAANDATLAKVFQSGLLTQERYDAIRQMFKYYIPLQGWDETTSDEVYAYLAGHDRGLGGNVIKRAEGRRSKADDPIATMAMQADAAIRQGNRNIMKRCFLNFVQNHPSDLVSMNHLWLKYDDVTDEWQPVFADIKESDSAADVARKVAAFEARMAQLATQDPDHYKSGREARDIPYKVVKGNLSEHQILVKRNGISYVLTINGSPRAAQALNGLTNPDVDMGGVVGNMLKAAEWTNRNLSAFYTTRNPDFVVSNFFRDMLYSNCMAWVKEGGNYALRFHWNFGRVNPFRLRKLVGKWEKGTLDRSNYLENMFYLFMRNGGETGYTNVKDIEGHKRTIMKELKRQDNRWRRVWHALEMQLDMLNRAVENCARFAAFVTSQELGRSMERSIWDAKEVSVNFNKKGSGGKMVNATGQTTLGKVGSYIGGGGRLAFVFWNAGVQGTTNFARAFKRHPVKATVGAASMFMLGTVIPLLAQWMIGGGDDDDDRNEYYNLPEYVRRSNILIWAGGQWIAIPLPIEFRALYGLGELATGVITRNERYSNSELAFQMGSQVSQVLPLDMLEGGGGINPFIPSLAKPVVEAYILNESWSGLPIYKDTPFNQRDPEWTKAYQSANRYLVSASKWLNEFGGGDDYKKADWSVLDINPAKVEYLLSGVFGGWFSTADKLIKMGETKYFGHGFGDREFDWRNMLIANRVVKTGDERTADRKLKNEYFKYEDEYKETKRLLKKYSEAADSGVLGYAEKLSFLNHSKEYGRYQIFDAYNGLLESYRESGDLAGESAVMREMVDLLHDYDDNKPVDAESVIDTRLRQTMMSNDSIVSKKAASELAKRAGGKDGYGSSDKAYNAIYTELRNDVDLDEDTKLQVAESDAKKAGDKARESEIRKARLEVTNARKELETTSDREAAMEHLRRVRRGAIERLGL